jgi:hypothetical protein
MLRKRSGSIPAVRTSRGDALAGLEQVQRHRRAHLAEPDETDLHLSMLLPETTLNARIGGSISVLTHVNLAVHRG